MGARCPREKLKVDFKKLEKKVQLAGREVKGELSVDGMQGRETGIVAPQW